MNQMNRWRWMINQKTGWCPFFDFWSLFLGFFFYVDDFSSLVLSTVGANGMRKPHFTTIAALNEIRGFERVMCPAAVSSALRKFSFWKRNHFYTPVKNSSPVIFWQVEWLYINSPIPSTSRTPHGHPHGHHSDTSRHHVIRFTITEYHNILTGI